MDCSDQEIIRQVNNGQKECFAELVRRYQQQAHKLALSVLRQPADAEDAVSEAFVKAFTALPRCRDDTNFKSWFLTITYNCCRDILRKRAKEGVPLAELAESSPGYAAFAASVEAGTDNPQELLERKEMKESIWRALDGLTPEERAAVILKYYHDSTYQEISAILQWPAGSVASRLFRAREKLQAGLKGVV